MEEADDTKLCSNCKKDIAAANFVMHEMHCRRHIVLCEVCDEPIPRSEVEQHFNDIHAKVPCNLCKVEIAKEEMENHMENVCPKKQVMCEFCELSVNKDTIKAHSDYCGSRTEPCSLCQQYIMLKDMIRHESSGCTYPEPKPAPANLPASSAPHDPFSMAYLHDFLDSDFGHAENPAIPDFTAGLRNELLRGKNRPTRGGNSSSSSVRTRTNQSSTRGRQPRRSNKTNVNADRERESMNSFPGAIVTDGIPPGIPPDMDYDTMLALQLAHEEMENQAGNVDRERDEGRYINSTSGGEWRSMMRSSPNREEQTWNIQDGDMTIPCEFCELEIPVDIYMQHTDYCQQSSGLFGTGDNSSSGRGGRNNSVPTSVGSTRPAIPVIDNLRPSLTHDRVNEIAREPSNLLEDFSLPCEFCEEMFPSEIILQHQVVCPLNGTATPRAVTPVRSKRKNRDNRSVDTTSNINPSLYMSDDEKEADTDSDGGPQSNFFRDSSYKNSLQSSSIKYGAAPVPRFDESSIRTPYRAGGRRQSRDGEGWEQDSGAAITYEPPRQNRSAQRARTRLNQLLQEPIGDDDQDSHSGQRNSNRSNHVNNHSRREPRPNNDKNAKGYSDPRNVNSRTVMRELERAPPAIGGGPGSRSNRGVRTYQPPHNNSQTAGVPTRSKVNHGTNTSSSSSTTTTTNPSQSSSSNTSSSSTRHRQRSDHVFSPELRPKPRDNNNRRQ